MKKTITTVLAAATIFCTLLPGLASALTPEELFLKVSPAVWVVIPRDEQGRVLGSGSAVVVSPGRLITNCHVLRKATSLTLRREREELPARLDYPDPERDLCQLRTDNLPTSAPATVATTIPRVGQKAFAIGAPRGLEQSLSDGLISALRRNAAGELEYIQVTAPISPGSSGGGLFDEQGRLIGITTAAVGGSAQNLNFARPAQWIAEVPARGRVAMAEYRRTEKPSATATPPLAPMVVQSSEAARPLASAAPIVSAVPVTSVSPVASFTSASKDDARPAGQNASDAEQLAKAQRCSTEPRASLVGKNPGVETYTVACADGYALLVKCEAGSCQELK
ncbi:S1C family serine protease [Variovorax sp. 770b2]|uniref:S1C family serine protease n=1 Tax=Variovorax sp. 770b2 TaxID=1566271 RepID=UPI0008E293A1|nr:serine protease [Variovorax sp. 770b2]SFQ03560.1 Trypsin-like peptidase domain-containing protein [Variovorax sp. 770b2]